MTTTTPESRAQMAYTAYGLRVQFRNHQGDFMPVFDDLPEQIQQAWIAAAQVIWDIATTGHATLTNPNIEADIQGAPRDNS
jgi:hypothetical protein